MNEKWTPMEKASFVASSAVFAYVAVTAAQGLYALGNESVKAVRHKISNRKKN